VAAARSRRRSSSTTRLVIATSTPARSTIRVGGVGQQHRRAAVGELAERQPDRAGVHQVHAAVQAHQRHVGVAAGEHDRRPAGEHLVELRLGRRRQQVLDVRSRRAVEQVQRRRAIGERVLALVAHQPRAIGGGELVRAPRHRVVDDRRLGVARDQRRLEQELVVVAQDARRAEVVDRGQHLARVRPERRDVAEAHHGVDAVAAGVGQHRLDGDQVAVQIRDQRDAHRVTRRPGGSARPPPRRSRAS
jgi:hypothetical protein